MNILLRINGCSSLEYIEDAISQQMSWLSSSSVALFCGLRYKGCDVNVSAVNGPCMVSCSLQFDLLYISVMVSVYCKKKGTLVRGKLYTYVWVEG